VRDAIQSKPAIQVNASAGTVTVLRPAGLYLSSRVVLTGRKRHVREALE
jgi:hypothetical protein